MHSLLRSQGLTIRWWRAEITVRRVLEALLAARPKGINSVAVLVEFQLFRAASTQLPKLYAPRAVLPLRD